MDTTQELEAITRRVMMLEFAARQALYYLVNATSEEFARGTDKPVRAALAAALGVREDALLDEKGKNAQEAEE